MTQLRQTCHVHSYTSLIDFVRPLSNYNLKAMFLGGYLQLLFTSMIIITNLKPFHISVEAAINNKLIGVQPDRRSLYDLEPDKTFNCLDGSGTIPMGFVNDDYCDCRDASDEPGTSACPHGRFYCINEGYIQRLIPSSWVNDGQCDCCDTSDEYNSNATCEHNCGVLGELYRIEQEKHREISDQGSAIRSQYKQQAAELKEQNGQLLEQYKRDLSEKELAIKKLEDVMNADFGPDQIYLNLKGKCFNFNDREYTYTLCPFERATQESTGGMQTELGRWAGWAGPADNLYIAQKYDGGIQCWNGPARSALVHISCGIEDKITSVTEPSKCEYVYNFITPAACPDLDPPEPVKEDSGGQDDQNQDPNLIPPSLEVEDDVGTEIPNDYNDHQIDPDNENDVERHEEL